MEKQFTDYINFVCQEVKDPKNREQITLELSGHLASFYDEFMSQGIPHDEAVTKALATMKDAPENLGRLLQEVYTEVEGDE